MLEQLTSSEITELLAFYYTKNDAFKKDLERETAPQKLRDMFKGQVVKKHG